MPSRFLIWTFLVALTVEGSPSRAGTTSFQGRIMDTTGSPVQGAAVSATAKPGIAASSVSDRAGEFRLELSQGQYVLTLSADGYAPARQVIRFSTCRSRLASRVPR